REIERICIPVDAGERDRVKQVGERELFVDSRRAVGAVVAGRARLRHVVVVVDPATVGGTLSNPLVPARVRACNAPIGRAVEALVDRAVAVVVATIADLVTIMVDRGGTVVAVGSADQ